MVIDIHALLIQALVVLLFSALFSGIEIAFVSSSKLRFEMEREKRGLSTRILDIFYHHPNHFISTILVGNNIALVVYGIIMAQVIDISILQCIDIDALSPHGYGQVLRLLLQTLLSTIIVLVIGEFLPKALFRINPNRMLRIFCIPMLICYIALWPISKFATLLSKGLFSLFGAKVQAHTADKGFTKVDLDHLIQTNIDNVKDEKKIEDEVRIFQNALDFSNLKVRDCAIPRTEVAAVSDTTTLQDIKSQFIETGYSKIMVYRNDIDNILGYIHSSEMFRLQAGEDWTKHMREISFVPETMNAQKLMQALIAEKRTVAVVVDEFGGTSGIVTLEDLVEEIFGEIEDEHDNDNRTAKKINDNEYDLSARLEIEKVNETFGLDLPESDDYQTIGGLILFQHQRFPKLNEVVRIKNWEFKVTQQSTTRIEQVHLKRLHKPNG